jgi:hypothetical protein
MASRVGCLLAVTQGGAGDKLLQEANLRLEASRRLIENLRLQSAIEYQAIPFSASLQFLPGTAAGRFFV